MSITPTSIILSLVLIGLHLTVVSAGSPCTSLYNACSKNVTVSSSGDCTSLSSTYNLTVHQLTLLNPGLCDRQLRIGEYVCVGVYATYKATDGPPMPPAVVLRDREFEYYTMQLASSINRSRANCQGFGGELASVRDEREDLILSAVMGMARLRFEDLKTERAWFLLGMYTEKVGNNSHSIKNWDGTPISQVYSDFAKDEPNGEGLSCVITGFNVSSEILYRWQDSECSDRYFPLCKRLAVDTSTCAPGPASAASPAPASITPSPEPQATSPAPASGPGAGPLAGTTRPSNTSTTLSSPYKGTNRTVLIIAVVVVVAGLVLIGSLIYTVVRLKRRQAQLEGGLGHMASEGKKPPSTGPMCGQEADLEEVLVGFDSHDNLEGQRPANQLPAVKEISHPPIGVAAVKPPLPGLMRIPPAPTGSMTMGGGGGSLAGSPAPVGLTTPSHSDVVGLGVGVSIMAVCVALAAEVVAAGDRVVANHVRCKRIARRIAIMRPMLEKLQVATQRHEINTEDIGPLLMQILSVMEDCKRVMKKWEDKGDSTLGLLKAMVGSRDYEAEFMDLNERLSCAYNDLGLVLHVSKSLQEKRTRNQIEQEVRGDTLKDLQGMAKEMAANSQLWTRLTPEQQQQLSATYQDLGLDLEPLLDQLKIQARHQFIDARMQDLIIKWQEITVEANIGSGGFGEVYRARWQGQTVALKVLQVTQRTARLEAALKREAYIMTQLRHPNVAMCYGMVLQPETYALVMEYYPKGTLTQLLQNDALPLGWSAKLLMALEVAQGMRYLHSKPFEPVIHGDLKSDNVLISGGNKLVITDFGLSKVQTLTGTTRVVGRHSAMSVVYAAPELITNPELPKSQASDVFAFGMLMYEIATRHVPFPNSEAAFIMNHIAQGGRPTIPEGLPAGYGELMSSCWCHEAAGRPTFEEVVEVMVTIKP